MTEPARSASFRPMVRSRPPEPPEPPEPAELPAPPVATVHGRDAGGLLPVLKQILRTDRALVRRLAESRDGAEIVALCAALWQRAADQQDCARSAKAASVEADASRCVVLALHQPPGRGAAGRDGFAGGGKLHGSFRRSD